MKLFIVDIMGCLELPHYEMFFYKDIKEGRIALFNSSLTSIDDLPLVCDWLTDEVNRNPFSIDKGIVVFFAPRDLTGRRIPMDYENYVKLCVNELVSRHLDERFKFKCFFLDKADRNVDNDSEYQNIKDVCEAFASDNHELRNSFLPLSFAPKDDNAAETKDLIISLGDDVAKRFYLRVLENMVETDASDDDIRPEDWYGTEFLGNCNAMISDISDFHVAYYSGDASTKMECLLKTVEYICSFVQTYDAEKDFDSQYRDFLTEKSFTDFDPGMDNIKLRIAVLKRRLEEWKEPETAKEKTVEPHRFESENHSKAFEKEIEKASSTELKRLLNRDIKKHSIKELCEDEFTSYTMRSLQELIKNARKRMKDFCGERVSDFKTFFLKHKSDIIYRDGDEYLTENESESEQELAKLMNKYSVNELPGYSEELRLQQELNLIEEQIRETGLCLEKIRFLPFLFTTVFAVASVGLYYFGVQNSVFFKEHTLYVFVLYLLVAAILFSLVFISVKIYYRKKVGNLYKKSVEIVRNYLKGFAGKATEFERNINSAMNYYCCAERDNRALLHRHDNREYSEKVLWHRRRIAEILENLKYFDGFIEGAIPKDETSVPKLDLFEDDAMHSEFYQMQIF